MSRPDPPRSTIVENIRQQSETTATDKNPPPARPFTRKFNIKFAKFARWLHIYLSMLSLFVVLFFSVTGITLNHPDWFFANTERRVQEKGKLDPKWLGPPATENVAPAAEPAENQKTTPARAGIVAKLEIVEHLRATHHIRAALAEFRAEENECVVTFKGPGYAADAFIDRETGAYDVTQTFHGIVAVLNDLHKGRDTGLVWSVVIDVSAVFMTIVSLSGLVLLFYLKLRRVPGLIVGVVGTVVTVLIYLTMVY